MFSTYKGTPLLWATRDTLRTGTYCMYEVLFMSPYLTVLPLTERVDVDMLLLRPPTPKNAAVPHYFLCLYPWVKMKGSFSSAAHNEVNTDTVENTHTDTQTVLLTLQCIKKR